MRSKAINPLGMIFTIFILIIASLVVINMITNINITPVTTQVSEWTKVNQYTTARTQCTNLCDNYRVSAETKAAVDFCLSKAKVDLNGNNKVGDKAVGAIVQGIPLCEDGIYCFHIYPECTGGQRLDAKTCKSILCRYYQETWGYDATTSMKAITSEITYGTCDPTVVKNDATGKTAADWWKDAGYSKTTC